MNNTIDELQKEIFFNKFTGDVEFPFYGKNNNDTYTIGGVEWIDIDKTDSTYLNKFINTDNYNMCRYIVKNTHILGSSNNNINKKNIIDQAYAYINYYDKNI
jgi:hypothetical protein